MEEWPFDRGDERMALFPYLYGWTGDRLHVKSTVQLSGGSASSVTRGCGLHYVRCG